MLQFSIDSSGNIQAITTTFVNQFYLNKRYWRNIIVEGPAQKELYKSSNEKESKNDIGRCKFAVEE